MMWEQTTQKLRLGLRHSIPHRLHGAASGPLGHLDEQHEREGPWKEEAGAGLTHRSALYPWHTLTQHRTFSWFACVSPKYLHTMFPPRLKPTTTSWVRGYVFLM